MIHMNEIEELETIQNTDHKDVQRTHASGTDHLRSQTQHQRLADTHALRHFKQVIELLSKTGSRFAFDRLFLAGPKTSVAEIEKLLPKTLNDKLADNLALSIHAGSADVLEAAIKHGEVLARAQEQEIVNNLITMAHKHDKAVLGIEAVAAASMNGQVATLVYTPGIEHKIESVSSKVLTTGGKLAQVSGPAAEALDRAGGVGAYPRFNI